MTLVARSADYADVEAVLLDYFNGLYFGSTEVLRRVFHAQAHYFCATDGNLLHYDMEAYFPMVDKRPSPASQSAKRTDRILSIEFAGPATALAKVQCSIPPKHFNDYLCLGKVDGRWQILSKVFHYDLESPGTSSASSST